MAYSATAYSFADGASGAVGIQGYLLGSAAPSAWVNLPIKDWEGDITWVEHDTSNTSTVGWQIAQKGKGKLTFTINAQLKLAAGAASYDPAFNPLNYATGPSVQDDYCSVILVGGTTPGSTTNGAGQTISSGSGNQLYSCTQCIVTSIKVTNKEGDVVSYTITGRSSGTVILNQGS